MAETSLIERLLTSLAATADPAAKAAIIAEITFDQQPSAIATVARRAIILRWFDEAILAALLPEETTFGAAEVVAQLAELPFVEKLAWGGLAYHDQTRTGLLARYGTEQPELLKQAAALAAPAYLTHAEPKLAGMEALFCFIVARQAEEASQQLVRLTDERWDQNDWNGLLALFTACDQAASLPFVIPLKYTAAHYYKLGITLRQFGKLDEAISAYQQSIACDERYAQPWHGLGRTYRDQKRYEEAIAAYQQSIVRNQKASYPWNSLGGVYEDQKRYAEAIAAYQQAIALDEKFAFAWSNLGNIYRNQQRYAEAIAAYQRAMTLDEKFANPWMGLGNVYRAQKSYEEAIAAYRQATLVDEKFVWAYSSLGFVFYQLERWPEAIATFQHAVTLDQNRWSDWVGLAGAALRNGDEEIWRSALAQAQPLVDYTDLYNAACFESVAGNIDRALELLTQAADAGRLDPAWAQEDPDLHWVRHDPRFWALLGEPSPP